MVERSATILPRFLSEGVLGNLLGGSPPTSNISSVPEGISRGFVLFVQSVNKAKTRQNERQVVQREFQTLQTNFAQPDLSMAQIRDYLCRLIYCNMLGYDVSFGIIHAVKLAQQGSHLDKKTGYLACCLLMHRDHELVLLLVNTIQKDLKSSNILDNLTALSACSQLVPVEMIPSLLPLVLDKLKHSRELVRHKAVLCLYQFQLLAPELLEHCYEDLKRALFDKDPGVMAAAMHIIQCNIEQDVSRCKDFGESLMSILDQIISRRMTSMFEYHGIPFPWLQIQILQCLSKLAAADGLTENLIPVLKKILQASSVKENMAFSILYECIRCIVNIKAPKHLLDEAAQHVERFLLSNHPNLKFIGVKLLVSLVQVNPEYSVNYQQLIVKSLDNSSRNIQKKMHTLLYQIANDSNVKVVCSKLLIQLQSSADKYWRSEVVVMVTDLVERYDRDVQWQIDTMFSCLHHGNDVIHDKLLGSIINVLEKKFIRRPESEARQKLLVQRCVRALVNGESFSSIHVSVWVLGELSPFLKNMPDDKVISLFTQHLADQKLPYHTHSCIVTALQHLIVNGVVQCENMAMQIQEVLKVELPILMKQRLTVLLQVCSNGLTLHYHDNSDIDTTLTFLDDLVTEDLEKGGAPYTPAHLRGALTDNVTTNDFTDSKLEERSSTGQEASSPARPRAGSSNSSTKTIEESELGLKIPGVKRVWGKQGRLDTSSVQKPSPFSNTEVNVSSEEEVHQQELASALFGGFQEKDKNQLREDDVDDIGGFNIDISDKAGWISLHATAVQTKSLPISTKPIGHLTTDKSKVVTKTEAEEHSTTDHLNFNQDHSESTSCVKGGNEQEVTTAPPTSPGININNKLDTNMDLKNTNLNNSYSFQTPEESSAFKEIDDKSSFDLDQALSALIENNKTPKSPMSQLEFGEHIFKQGLSTNIGGKSLLNSAIDQEDSLYSGYEEFKLEADDTWSEQKGTDKFDVDDTNLELKISDKLEENISIYTSDT